MSTIQGHSQGRSKTTRKPARATASGSAQASDEERWARIALSAYYKAEIRGFAPGHEQEDWLAAEAEVRS